MLFCHITTRIPGRKHDGLLSKVGGRGFPYLVYLDGDGKVVGKPQGRTVEAFEAGATRINRYMELELKKTRNIAEQCEFLELGLILGKVSAAEAKKRQSELGLPPKYDEKLSKVIRAKELDETVKTSTASIRSRADLQTKGPQVGEEFYKHHQNGDKPLSQEHQLSFFFFMLEYGVQKKVLDAAQVALKNLKTILAGNKRAARWLAMQEKRVKDIEGGGGGR